MPLDVKNCKPSLSCDSMCLLSCTQGDNMAPLCVTETIMKDQLGITALENRNSDQLDFYDLHVATLKKAIEVAFMEGRASVLRSQGATLQELKHERTPAGSVDVPSDMLHAEVTG